jgi:hypothetical protein
MSGELSSRAFGLVALAVVALFVGLRLVALDADPPQRFWHGISTEELLREPPAKAHEARNKALFGTFQTNPADNYQFWRAQSPMWVYPLSWSFSVLGVSTSTLRLTAIAWSVLGLLAVLVLARRALGWRAAVLAGIFLATHHVLIWYGRSGLIEPAVASWIAVGVLCLHLAWQDDARFVLLAELALVAAILTKQAALPAGALFAVAGLASWLRARGLPDETRTAWRVALAVAGVLVLVALAAYAKSEGYQRALSWNFNHTVRRQESFSDANAVAQAQFIQLRAVWAQASTLWRVYPILLTLGVVEVVRLLVVLARTRRLSAGHALLVGWFFSTALGHLLIKYAFVRYHLVFAPVLALLSASLVVHLAERMNKRAVPVVVAAAFCALHLSLWAGLVARATTTVVDASRALPAMLSSSTPAGQKPVVIGEMAGPLTLDNDLLFYYVKLDFNQNKAILDALGPTHLLVTHAKNKDGTYRPDISVRTIAKGDPELLARTRFVGSLKLRRLTIDVTALAPPGAAGEPAVVVPAGSADAGDDDNVLDATP